MEEKKKKGDKIRFKKKEIEIELKKGYIKCDSCKGRGIYEFRGQKTTCRKCNGVGQVKE
jgi:DnaJ-class molecular chaperone